MQNDLIQELGLVDDDLIDAITLAQTSIALYEETLISMGLIEAPIGSQFISNSQISYQKAIHSSKYYADLQTSD